MAVYSNYSTQTRPEENFIETYNGTLFVPDDVMVRYAEHVKVRAVDNAYIKGKTPRQELPYRVMSTRVVRPVGLKRSWDDSWVNFQDQVVPSKLDQDKIDFVNSKAVQNLYDKADDLDINYAVTLAELPKALRMISNTAIDLGNAYNQLKRGRVKSAFNTLRIDRSAHAAALRRKYSKVKKGLQSPQQFAASRILELNYGWKPLINDMVNAAVAANEEMLDEPSDLKIWGSETAIHPLKNEVSDRTYDSFSGEEMYRRAHIVYVQTTDPATRGAARLGLADVSSAAWEVVPFSFVADWFVPVGSWIAAQSAFNGTSFIKGSTATVHKWEWKSNLLISGGKEVTGCNNHTRHREFRREVLSSLPSTGEILRVNPWEEAYSATRAVNAIALLQTVFLN